MKEIQIDEQTPLKWPEGWERTPIQARKQQGGWQAGWGVGVVYARRSNIAPEEFESDRENQRPLAFEILKGNYGNQEEIQS